MKSSPASSDSTHDWGAAQTRLGSAIGAARRQPHLVVPFLKNSITRRIAGPLLSRWRPGSLALFHTGRCGSTVLTDLISQHPEVHWDGETYGRVVAGIKADGLNRNEVTFDPVDYVAARMKRSGRSWFGYDLKFSHVTEFGMSIEQYIDGIEQVGVSKIIALRRRNYLRQVISACNGGRRGHFHLMQGQSRELLPPLELEPHELTVDLYNGSLLEHFRRWDDLYSLLDQLAGTTALSLTYEDHIEHDPAVAFELVTEFLGLKPFKPTIRLQRSNPEPVSALLANYDEIHHYLASSSYAWMTEDN